MKISTLNEHPYLKIATQSQKMNGYCNQQSVVKKQSGSSDKIELSTFSRDVAKLVEQAKQQEPVNEARVNEIKAQLKQGTYEVSSEKLADAILSQLNLD